MPAAGNRPRRDSSGMTMHSAVEAKTYCYKALMDYQHYRTSIAISGEELDTLAGRADFSLDSFHPFQSVDALLIEQLIMILPGKLIA